MDICSNFEEVYGDNICKYNIFDFGVDRDSICIWLVYYYGNVNKCFKSIGLETIFRNIL